MKKHKVEPLLSDEYVEIMASEEASNWSPLHRRDAEDGALETIERVRDIYEAARAKDAEEIAKWKGIVKGVHGALNDIGTVPVPPMDADLYDVVMAIRAKDSELIQLLVDALQYLGDIGVWYPEQAEALNAAEAAGFKPTNP